MSTASMHPEITAALTITITDGEPTFEPDTQKVASGEIVKFRSGDHRRYEIQLWNATNDDPHPLRLFVPQHGGTEVVADPRSAPRDVDFNIISYPSSKKDTGGGGYTIKITSGGDGK
jgi:plastocyanin